MKRFKLFSNASALILTASMSLFIFAGCQSKTIQTNATNPSAASSTVDNNGSNKGASNIDAMKKRMKDNLDPLVADGTINQSQADKILDTLTTTGQKFNGQRKSQNPDKNNTPQNSNQQNNQQNTPNDNQQKPHQNSQNNNQLSSLVNDGVITQAQADTVMQKIRGNFKRTQNN